MDSHPTSHPSDQTLRDFGNGKLDEGAIDAVNRHVEACPRCQQRVAELGSDSFLGRLRVAHAGAEGPAPQPQRAHQPASVAVAVAPTATVPLELAEHPDYRVVRELGRGGMGVVFLAHNRLLGRDEVLKVVSRQMLERPGVPDRFRSEVRAAARLHHPNIVTAHAAFHAGESLVFAMEYVDGLDLARLVRAKGPLPVPHACYFIHQAALGLQHAHEQGMVHRDIKPGNLMLARPGGRAVVKVLDFGLAKATRETRADGALTHEGQMLGTPDYIAPEQIRDAQSADIRADVYSLGCTFYYLLTGGPPFEATNLYDLLQAHFSMNAAPLNLVRPEVPVELAALIARMMAKEPERRFQTPGEVAKALVPFFRSARPADAAPQATAGGAGDRWSSLAELKTPERPEPAPVPPPLPPAAQPEPQPAGPGRRTPRRLRLAGAAAGAAAMLGVIVIIININKKPDTPSNNAGGEPLKQEARPPRGRAQPPWLEPVVGREPEPAPGARRAQERALRDELSHRGDSRAALARELIDAARKPAAAGEDRFARLTLAGQLAGEDGAFALAGEACDELGRWYDVDASHLKADLLESHARFADTPAKQDDLACAALAAGFEALGLDDVRDAGTLARVAHAAAERADVGALVDQAALLEEDTARARSEYAALAPQLETLRARPDDPAACAAAGRYLCLARNDFARGLPLLARGDRPDLKALAAAEAKAAAAPKDDRTAPVAAGDLWWAFGEAGDPLKHRCRLRARFWYLQALALDGPPAGTETADRVRARLRQVPAREFRVRIRVQHADFHGLRIDGSGVKSVSNYGGMPTVTFNHLTWSAAKSPVVPNVGATRFLPDDVDYTTADLRNFHRTGGEWAQYGHAHAFAREDHAALQFSHWPNGAFDAELTMVFGKSAAGKDLAVEPDWDVKFFNWSGDDAKTEGADYWDRLFQGPPLTTATIRRFHYNDHTGGFAPGVPGNFFVLEATAEVQLPAGELEVLVNSDDGIMFYIDDRKVIAAWGAGGRWERVPVAVTAGKHTLRLRYLQIDRDARLMLRLRML